MGTIAVKRTFAVLLATLLAVVVYQAFSHSAKADVPAQPGATTSVADEGKRHRPVIDSGVKFVRNADGTVTQTR